jgi:hypothetical protein
VVLVVCPPVPEVVPPIWTLVVQAAVATTPSVADKARAGFMGGAL